jgi:hypothetical protein
MSMEPQPHIDTLLRPVLEVVRDANEVRTGDVVHGAAIRAGFPPRDHFVVRDAYWAITYLDKAKLLERPRRGWLRITARGLEALETDYELTVRSLRRFPEFQQWNNPRGAKDYSETRSDAEDLNVERLADALAGDNELREVAAAWAIGQVEGLVPLGLPPTRLFMLAMETATAIPQGQCRMASPASRLVPVLRPGLGGKPSLQWCCVDHADEHCSAVVG